MYQERNDDRRVPESGQLVALIAFRPKCCPEGSLGILWALEFPEVVGKDTRTDS